MKIKCRCGHIIVDQTDNLPYKGMIIRDKHWEAFHGWISDQVADFIRVAKEGKRKEWITEYYRGENLDLSDDSIVSDIITRACRSCCLEIYQCERCGRLYISPTTASEVTSPYKIFIPDQKEFEMILNVK